MNSRRYLLGFAALGALALALAIAPGLRAQTVEMPVALIKTTGGGVAGKVLPAGVQAWLAIPFAKPPVQSLRWLPPAPMSWRGVWNADRKMP